MSDYCDLSWPGFPVFTLSQSLLKPMSTESVMPSNHLILCRPLLLLPSIFPSIRGFSNGSALHIRWPKYWSFTFGISPSNEIHLGLTGLISLSKGLSRVFSSAIVQKDQAFMAQPSFFFFNFYFCGSAFFMVQLLHPYLTTGKTAGNTYT